MAEAVKITKVAKPASAVDRIEQVLVQGNLAALSNEERLQYLKRVCDDLGLNPLTQPFEFITLNGKLTMYAKKGCTDQLRASRKISVTIVNRESQDGLYVVTARATLPDGRQDEDVGAVVTRGLGGEALANAQMKAFTKAKRRVTLSICGLGCLDESELDMIPQAARYLPKDMVTGSPMEPPTLPPPTKSTDPAILAAQRKTQALADELGEKLRVMPGSLDQLRVLYGNLLEKKKSQSLDGQEQLTTDPASVTPEPDESSVDHEGRGPPTSAGDGFSAAVERHLHSMQAEVSEEPPF